MSMPQVYLPALRGYVPREMIRAVRAFLEFYYNVRRDTHNSLTLTALDDSLKRFHQYREIFVKLGVRKPDSFTTRQHALIHYARAIRLFGSPNGLCSSITESKHIDAVKKPWRRSSRFNALKQILKVNSRLDKLRAARVEFTQRGMLDGQLQDDLLSE
jgi:hypothetical protein